MKKYLFGFIGIVAAVAAFADVPPGTVGGDDVNPRTRLVTNAWENAKGDIMAAMADGEARPLPRYLHALTLFDAYPAEAAAYYATLAEVGGGCSAVRDGNTLARNFDFPFDDRAEFVITMQPGAGRFASVGVANVGTNLTEAMVNSGKHSAYYKCLPGATTDGVNENGVAACINVVSSFGHTNGWHGATVHYLAAVRRVLDTATNAADAAADLAANVYVPQSALDRGYSFHYIVADRTATYIVEDGEARPYTGRVVMTNYRLFDTGEPYGTGRERAALLANPDADITEAWFTLAYEADTRPIRYSEFVAPGVNPTNAYNAAVASWANGARETHRGKGFWQSVHTSIYDIENLTLKIAVQEIPDFYTFAIPQGGKVKSVNGKTGDVTITAQDVNAWDLSSDYNETTNEMNYLYFKGDNGRNLGYFQFGQDYNGAEIGLVDWNNPGGGQRYMFINLTGIQVYDGQAQRGFVWDDLITLDDVKSQYYPTSTYADYPISSKGVNDFAQHTFLTQLDNRFLKSTDAQSTYLSKTDAQSTYRTKADSFSKTESDDRYLSATGIVKRVYSADEKTYQDGDGNVYTLTGGSNWDVYDVDGYSEHMTFYPVGEYRWKTDSYVILQNPEPAYLFPTNSPFGSERWVIMGESGMIYEYKDGYGKDVDYIRFPILIANKVSAGKEWAKNRTVAYNESVAHLWNADATIYQDADGIVWEKQHDKFVGTESGITPEQDFIWNGTAYYCPDFIYRVSTRKPCTLSYIGSGWKLEFQDGDRYTSQGSLSAEKLIFSNPPATYEYRLTRKVPYVAINKVAYTNDIAGIDGMAANALTYTNGVIRTYDGTKTIDGAEIMTLIDAAVSQKINNAVNANMNTYVDGETGIEYVGKYYGGNLYYVPTGNVYPPNN